MLYLQNISYTFPNKIMLFDGLNLSIQKGEKIALVGNNGVGKSTLLQLISGQIIPSNGQIISEGNNYVIPQHFGQMNNFSIAEALQISDKLDAFHAILNGDVSEENYDVLADDWEIENRIQEAFIKWNLPELDLNQKLSKLSGGQKTKLFLAGIDIHQADLIIMDEPSNHLDLGSRQQLYQFIKETNKTLIVVSHDRMLLNLLSKVYNSGHLQEHDVKIRLNRFLFHKNDWDKTCNQLSGGEKMRLLLCCLTIKENAPDIIILDEPTNNLDIQNIEILTETIKTYQGSLLVVSHDEVFKNEINIEEYINF